MTGSSAISAEQERTCLLRRLDHCDHRNMFPTQLGRLPCYCAAADLFVRQDLGALALSVNLSREIAIQRVRQERADDQHAGI